MYRRLYLPVFRYFLHPSAVRDTMRKRLPHAKNARNAKRGKFVFEEVLVGDSLDERKGGDVSSLQ